MNSILSATIYAFLATHFFIRAGTIDFSQDTVIYASNKVIHLFGPNNISCGIHWLSEEHSSHFCCKDCPFLLEAFKQSSLMPHDPNHTTVWIYRELGQNGSHRMPDEVTHGALCALQQHNISLQQQSINWIARTHKSTDPVLRQMPPTILERINRMH